MSFTDVTISNIIPDATVSNIVPVKSDTAVVAVVMSALALAFAMSCIACVLLVFVLTMSGASDLFIQLSIDAGFVLSIVTFVFYIYCLMVWITRRFVQRG